MEYRIKRIGDDELMHYGVLGMKWGVRRYQNKDGSLTAAGRKKYIMTDKAQKAIANDVQKYMNSDKTYGADMNLIKTIPVLKGLHDSTRLNKAREDLRKLGDLVKDYDENDDVQYKYKIKALAKMRLDGEPADEAILRSKYSKNDMWLMYEDWDQGMTSSFALYIKDKGMDFVTFDNEVTKASKRYREECVKTVDALLGEHGKKPVVVGGKYEGRLVKDVIADGLQKVAEEETTRWYNWY